jgi:hypothetical protein
MRIQGEWLLRRQRWPAWQLATAMLVLFVSGCRKSQPVPGYDPPGAAAEALSLLDASGNGLIERDEAAKAPGLASAFSRFDADGNGALSAEEVESRVAAYAAARLGLMPFSCTISVNGEVHEGMAVRLAPEPFLEPPLAHAAAVTSAGGIAAPIAAGEQFPAVACGVYRVEISWKRDGGEALPARYNTQTELGVEIAPDVPGLERGVHFQLTAD